MFRLQGFPETYKINIPYSQSRKIAGNSVSVPVIKEIAREMLFSLKNKEPIHTELQQLNFEEF